MNYIAMCLADFYKYGHAEQFPDGTTYIASYMTPRMSRLKQKELIVFGIKGFAANYLIELFNQNFFKLDEDEVMDELVFILTNTLSCYIDFEKFRALHRLGYLPIQIRALPEGTKCPIQVPILEISNTHPDFAWVVQFVESIMSAELWYPMTIANQAYKYRMIANEYYHDTVENNIPIASAMSEFGFRGGKGSEASILASSSFLTSFNKTATLPAVIYLSKYYGGNIGDGDVGSGMISTEHAVMCSNAAVDGDEKTFVKKLLTKLYPSGNISIVSDSYDYWNMVTNIYGDDEIKNIIMNRNGTVYVRGDSGDPVDILCGTIDLDNVITHENEDLNSLVNFYKQKAFKDFDWNCPTEATKYLAKIDNTYYDVVCHHEWQADMDDEDCYDESNGYYTGNVESVEFTERLLTNEELGTVRLLWEIFGGTINSKGYKVLNPHIRAIYGDSITPVRAKKIYHRLKKNGFAANNVSLGVGSFSMQCDMTENAIGYDLAPFTRDTYGIAIKATYMEIGDNHPLMVFKNPKTDKDNFKKSQRGMCYVHLDKNKQIVCQDGFTRANLPNDSLYHLVFKDGKIYDSDTIYTIRDRIHDGNF